MKKAFVVICIIISFAIEVNAQANQELPSFENLVSWAKMSSQTSLDSKFRSAGFSFNEKRNYDDHITFEYIKKIKQSSETFTAKLLFKKYKSFTAFEMVTDYTDLIIYYQKKLLQNGFKTTACTGTDTNSKLVESCYEKSKLGIRFTDERKDDFNQFNMMFYNVH